MRKTKWDAVDRMQTLALFGKRKTKYKIFLLTIDVSSVLKIPLTFWKDIKCVYKRSHAAVGKSSNFPLHTDFSTNDIADFDPTQTHH